MKHSSASWEAGLDLVVPKREAHAIVGAIFRLTQNWQLTAAFREKGSGFSAAHEVEYVGEILGKGPQLEVLTESKVSQQ